MDMEEAGEVSSDDKEEIYQYILSKAITYMTEGKHSKFVDGLVDILELRKRVSSELESEN